MTNSKIIVFACVATVLLILVSAPVVFIAATAAVFPVSILMKEYSHKMVTAQGMDTELANISINNSALNGILQELREQLQTFSNYKKVLDESSYVSLNITAPFQEVKNLLDQAEDDFMNRASRIYSHILIEARNTRYSENQEVAKLLLENKEILEKISGMLFEVASLNPHRSTDYISDFSDALNDIRDANKSI